MSIQTLVAEIRERGGFIILILAGEPRTDGIVRTVGAGPGEDFAASKKVHERVGLQLFVVWVTQAVEGNVERSGGLPRQES